MAQRHLFKLYNESDTLCNFSYSRKSDIDVVQRKTIELTLI